MLAFECANPLWGRTLNPYSAEYTCGGSSGGEGALLGASGSALGFGSDIGGSLRIPAGMCGIYSLKPSVGRISSIGALGGLLHLLCDRMGLMGNSATNPGFSFITSVVGPMGRYGMLDSITEYRVTDHLLGLSLT